MMLNLVLNLDVVNSHNAVLLHLFMDQAEAIILFNLLVCYSTHAIYTILRHSLLTH